MRKASLLIIFLSVFIDLVGFGIVLPLVPVYSERFGASGFLIGLIFASYSLMQFVCGPVWGRISDRIGRRPVILLSNLGACGSYALFAYGSTRQDSSALMWIMISRVFAGICGANLSVASAYIADVSPPEKRSKGMGLIGMAFGFGFILGPAIGALSLSSLGDHGPGLLAACLCGFNFFFGLFLLGESRKPDSEAADANRPRFGQWGTVLKRPVVGRLIGIYFLATVCFSCFESTFSLVLVSSESFGFELKHVGYLFAYAGLIGAIVQGGMIGRLVKKYGEVRIIVVSLFVVAAGMVAMPLAGTLATLLVALTIFSVGSGMNRPPVFGLISLRTPADEQGATMGVTQGVGSLARIIGPLFAATLNAQYSGLPYYICAGVAFLAACLAVTFLKGVEDSVDSHPVEPTASSGA